MQYNTPGTHLYVHSAAAASNIHINSRQLSCIYDNMSILQRHIDSFRHALSSDRRSQLFASQVQIEWPQIGHREAWIRLSTCDQHAKHLQVWKYQYDEPNCQWDIRYVPKKSEHRMFTFRIITMITLHMVKGVGIELFTDLKDVIQDTTRCC